MVTINATIHLRQIQAPLEVEAMAYQVGEREVVVVINQDLPAERKAELFQEGAADLQKHIIESRSASPELSRLVKAD